MSKRLILKELSRYNIGTFTDIIYRNSLLYPDQGAFVYGDTRITFSEFNTRLKADELDYIINYSEASILFVGPELLEMANSLRPRLTKVKNFISLECPAPGMITHQDLLASQKGQEPDVQVTEDDPVGIIYTSGTTGVPRGALSTHRRLIEDSKILALDMSLQPGHRRVLITPLFHIAGNSHFRSSLYTGGCIIILKFFDPAAALKAIQDEKATHMDIVPTHLAAMLNTPDLNKYKISSLTFLWYGASPMPLEILKKGMNDVAPGEVGEVIIRSKQMMAEYWHKPDETRANIIDGWLHTGDMCYYDEKGYIYIADRKKDMIISGGENVYPREVEEVLYRHPAVMEATVIGIPDPYWVEKVHAIVALKKGAQATAEEIVAFCKKNIAGYKTPKSIEFVDALPKNAAGKILKRELRDKYWKGTQKEKKG